jgi:hypothetical protein
LYNIAHVVDCKIGEVLDVKGYKILYGSVEYSDDLSRWDERKVELSEVSVADVKLSNIRQ